MLFLLLLLLLILLLLLLLVVVVVVVVSIYYLQNSVISIRHSQYTYKHFYKYLKYYYLKVARDY